MPSSVHSYGARSTTSIATTTRSRTLPGGSRKVKLHWWERRPILANAFFIDLQKGSYLASIYSLVESFLQIILAIFDLYCLIEAAPGSKHSRNFGISFMFVYSGNQHVRRSLMAVSLILFLSAVYLFAASLILMAALRKEHELKFRHWLRAMALFIVLRFIFIIYQSIVNDLFFLYHQLMLALWFLLTAINVFVWLVVYSNYQELSDITRLEDMAKLKMSTLSSLNASRSFHSLDSANPYGRYGGPATPGSFGGASSIQPSPQIYHHQHPVGVSNQPFTIHESHQNIVAGGGGGVGVGGVRPSAAGPSAVGGGRSHHSSQNSLHQSYLQMYSNTLSQRSRQSSTTSLSVNAFPMQSYDTGGGGGMPPEPAIRSSTLTHQQQPFGVSQRLTGGGLTNQPPHYGAFGATTGTGGGYPLSRNTNTSM